MSKKHHTIELDDLNDWLSTKEFVYANSTRENKQLKINTKGTFIVSVGDEVIYTGTQPYSAVEAYNSITNVFIRDSKNSI